MVFYIIGYMASGKTTFGKALAARIKAPFVDLDSYIEAKAGCSIPQIFEQRGEEGFRLIERTALREIKASEGDNLVVACGGGTPCHFDNMEFLNKNGITIFLETSTPVLISRLQAENESRPLVAGKTNEEIEQKVLTQLCRRLPHYMESKLKWHGDDLETQEQIENNVANFVSSYPSLFH